VIPQLNELAVYAGDVLRALGDASAPSPGSDAGGTERLRARVLAHMDAVRPMAGGPSLGEVLRPMVEAARRDRLDLARGRRPMAELEALFEQAAFRRTKRAERGRLFAELVVLFGIEGALGVEGGAAMTDAEGHLRAVRRRLRGKP